MSRLSSSSGSSSRCLDMALILGKRSSMSLGSIELMDSFSFLRPDKLPGPIERYNDEVKRVLGVLELHLSKPENKGYLVGGRYTIADLSFIAWLDITEKLPIKLADYPAVHKWFTEMRNRPETHKGYVGGPYERK
jgi:glutathione S-transferase